MMTDAALQQATTLLAPWAKETTTPSLDRVDVQIDSGSLLDAVRALTESHWGYLSAITGLDLGVEKGEFEVLYHFCASAAILTLRVHISRTEAAIPSVCEVLAYASFFERELSEMLGITVVNTPDPSRLFLPDDWPEGVYPLRKDFAGQETSA